MSTPILPYALWLSGTNQNSIPANDNSLRNQILHGNIISQSVTAQPASPTEGDAYIIASTHTGAQWSTFTPKDLAIYSGGTWIAYAPVEGVQVSVAGSSYKYTSGAWTAAGGGGSVAGSDKQIQYNNAGAFGAEAGFEYDQVTNTLTIANATYTGLALTAASATGGAGFRLPHGAAPTSPTNGDVWTTTSGFFARINGTTVGPFAAGFSNPMTTTGDVIYSSSGTTPARLGIGSTGDVLTVAGGVPTWSAPGSASLTGFTSALTTGAPNTTNNVSSLTASGGTASQSIALVPKTVGGLLAAIPTSTSAGGNVRGNTSVDWQMVRSAATQVASGASAVIGGGENNTASGSQSAVPGGSNNFAAGTASFAGGQSGTTGSSATSAIAYGANATANGLQSAAFGNTATGDVSMAVGANAIARTRGSVANSSGQFAAQGDAQVERLVHRISTANATPTALSANGVAPAAATCAVLPNNSVFAFEITIAAKVSSFGDRATYKITGQISRNASAAATAIDGTPTITTIASIGGASAWVAAVNANTTLGSLEVTVTGAASTTIKWVASIVLTEVVG
jgi:hypothetical protein